MNWIGTKSDTIRLKFDSDPLHFGTIVLHLHRADRLWNDGFVRTLCGLFQQSIAFPSFRSLRKLLLEPFLVQWQCSPIQTFPTCLRHFRKHFHIEGYLHFLRYLFLAAQKRGNFSQKFPTCVLPFHPVLFIKEQFLLAFCSPNLPTCFKNVQISRIHWAFSPLLVQNIRLRRSGYNSCTFPLRYFLSG